MSVDYYNFDAIMVAKHVELWWMYLSDNDTLMLHELGIQP